MSLWFNSVLQFFGLNPSPGKTIDQTEIRYLLEGTGTNGALALFGSPIPPNARAPDSNHQT